MWRNRGRAALLCGLLVVASSLSPIVLRAAVAGGDVQHGKAIFLQYCQGCHGPGKSAFMPVWKTTLSQQDIADVVAFIRTFVVE
jgi:mono/diheme cytochrome c family protein